MVETRNRIPVLPCVVAGAAVLLLAMVLIPGAEAGTITGTGPITAIQTTSTLRGNVHNTYQSQDVYWPPTTGATPGDFATWVGVGGVLYGPGACSLCPAGTAYTAVSQSVTGIGTPSSPYLMTTVVTLGASGIRLTQVDSYINGNTYYMTMMTLRNMGAAPASLQVWRGADCYLNNADPNYGAFNAATVEVTCSAAANSLTPSPYIRWLSTTGNPTFTEEGFGSLWQKISSQTTLTNTCLCTTYQDGAAGLNWQVSLNGGAEATLEHCTEFAPMPSGITCQPPVLCAPETVSVVAGNPVQLNATGGDGSYTWSTGGSGPTTTVTYTSSGTYTVTVTDGNGQQGTCTIDVTPPGMTCSPGTQTVFYNTGVVLTVNGGESPWAWSSPGGTPTGQSASPSTTYSTYYPVSGTYTVTVTDNAGQIAVCEIEVIDPPLYCDPIGQWTLVGDYVDFRATGGSGSYSWSAPGGRPPSGGGPRFSTSYDSAGSRLVTVTSAAQSETCAVEVYVRPQASFTFVLAAVAPCEDYTVQFRDTSTPGGFPIVQFYWEFGDGGSSAQQNPLHKYRDAGTYRASLLVVDSQGTTSLGFGNVTLDRRDCQSNREESLEQGPAPDAPRDGTDAAIAGADSDSDGVVDADDLCPSVADPAQGNLDRDAKGDACDPDMDGDKVLDMSDGCRAHPDPQQHDMDHDGAGDVCDDDRDGDLVGNLTDVCPLVADGQADADQDGTGDACEPTPAHALAGGEAGKSMDEAGPDAQAGVATPVNVDSRQPGFIWALLALALVAPAAAIGLSLRRRRA